MLWRILLYSNDCRIEVFFKASLSSISVLRKYRYSLCLFRLRAKTIFTGIWGFFAYTINEPKHFFGAVSAYRIYPCLWIARHWSTSLVILRLRIQDKSVRIPKTTKGTDTFCMQEIMDMREKCSFPDKKMNGHTIGVAFDDDFCPFLQVILVCNEFCTQKKTSNETFHTWVKKFHFL